MKVWLVGQGWESGHEEIVGVFLTEELADERADLLMSSGEWKVNAKGDGGGDDYFDSIWSWTRDEDYVWIEEWSAK